MKKDEFEERLKNINIMISEANKLRKEVAFYMKSLPSSGADFLKTVSSRDNFFVDYLKAISEFDYSDKLTSPSDLFPGIRTTAQMADPEDLGKKAEEMRKDAANITSLANSATSISVNSVNSMKKCLAAMSELTIQENQIYDFCMDLLKDMDSIYEIGQLSKSAT